MRALTFRGTRHRVQLSVLDRLSPPSFAVYAMAAYHHPSTAFRAAGTQAYFGEDFAAAWAAVLRHCPRAEVPSGWVRFVEQP